MAGVECRLRGLHIVVKYQVPAVSRLHRVRFGLQSHETCGCSLILRKSLALLVVVVVAEGGEVAVAALVVEVSEEVVQGIGLLRTTGRGLVAPVFEAEDGENRLLDVMYVHSRDKSWICYML
jgi:hypothetical protein